MDLAIVTLSSFTLGNVTMIKMKNRKGMLADKQTEAHVFTTKKNQKYGVFQTDYFKTTMRYFLHHQNQTKCLTDPLTQHPNPFHR